MHPRQTSCVPVSEGLGYLPQLDTLRAFAVLLVVWHHWFGPRELGLGPMGVWIFFVISGFLITRILLSSKGATPRENRSALVRFYVRRFLRIFPLYYFVLLVALFTSAAFRADWRWYVSYLQNFLMMRASEEAHLFGVHFWTLAVEEQFYLCWPWIVLFVPRFVLGPVIAGAGDWGCLARQLHRVGMGCVSGLCVHAVEPGYAGTGGVTGVCRDPSARKAASFAAYRLCWRSSDLCNHLARARPGMECRDDAAADGSDRLVVRVPGAGGLSRVVRMDDVVSSDGLPGADQLRDLRLSLLHPGRAPAAVWPLSYCRRQRRLRGHLLRRDDGGRLGLVVPLREADQLRSRTGSASLAIFQKASIPGQPPVMALLCLRNRLPLRRLPPFRSVPPHQAGPAYQSPQPLSPSFIQYREGHAVSRGGPCGVAPSYIM